MICIVSNQIQKILYYFASSGNIKISSNRREIMEFRFFTLF